MTIKVLGSGCASCVRLEENTKQAIKELALAAEVEHVYDMVAITSYGVMSTPALVVDERVVLSGKVPSTQEIKQILGNL